MKKLYIALFGLASAFILAIVASPAFCQQGTPFLAPDISAERISISASGGNAAAGTASATLPVIAGKTNCLCGFSITSTGSIGAAVVSPTVTGLVGGTMTFTYATVAGVTTANPSLVPTSLTAFGSSPAANRGKPPRRP